MDKFYSDLKDFTTACNSLHEKCAIIRETLLGLDDTPKVWLSRYEAVILEELIGKLDTNSLDTVQQEVVKRVSERVKILNGDR